MKSAAHVQNDNIISKYISNVKGFNILDTKNIKFEWLIPNFLSKQSLNMIYAGAGSGKSMFVLHLCNYIFKNKTSIDEIFYFDADNGADVLQSRHADQIVENSDGKLKYILANSLSRFNFFKNFNKQSKARVDKLIHTATLRHLRVICKCKFSLFVIKYTHFISPFLLIFRLFVAVLSLCFALFWCKHRQALIKPIYYYLAHLVVDLKI